VQREEAELDETDVVNLKKWLLTVGQAHGAKELALKMNPVVTMAAVFEEWAFGHLNSYLGEKGDAQSNQTVGAQSPAQSNNAFLEDLVKLLFANQGNNQGTAATAGGDKAGDEKVKAYSPYDQAKLMGYCNEWDPAQLPNIWKLFKTTKETDDHRDNLERAMKEWSQQQGIEIDKSIFFTKETMDDIVKMHFNSVGLSATLTTCEKGISNLLCLPRTAGEVEALKLFEQAIAATQATRTLKEAERIASSNKREPPSEYYSLKLMVATYAALLYVLFGANCHLYIKVL
jgi:hypothetical protein